MTTRCPNCGSSAQPRVVKEEYQQDGWEITLVRTYECGCGCRFTGASVYVCLDGWEAVEEI